jgi:hypothetical protein
LRKRSTQHANSICGSRRVVAVAGSIGIGICIISRIDFLHHQFKEHYGDSSVAPDQIACSIVIEIPAQERSGGANLVVTEAKVYEQKDKSRTATTTLDACAFQTTNHDTGATGTEGMAQHSRTSSHDHESVEGSPTNIRSCSVSERLGEQRNYLRVGSDEFVLFVFAVSPADDRVMSFAV